MTIKKWNFHKFKIIKKDNAARDHRGAVMESPDPRLLQVIGLPVRQVRRTHTKYIAWRILIHALLISTLYTVLTRRHIK